jgi:hypothetical protein
MILILPQCNLISFFMTFFIEDIKNNKGALKKKF